MNLEDTKDKKFWDAKEKEVQDAMGKKFGHNREKEFQDLKEKEVQDAIGKEFRDSK